MAQERVKGCPNEQCENHIHQVKQYEGDEYCPKCGSRLVYVCANCFQEIENQEDVHRFCNWCEAAGVGKRVRRRDSAKNMAIKAGGIALKYIITPVGIGLLEVAVSKGQKGAVKVGTKLIDKAIDAVKASRLK